MAMMRSGKANLYDELMSRRDRERLRQKEAICVVKGKELAWEVNPQGVMKWYLHPDIEETAIRSLLVYVQQIPPRSYSGRQRYQGGMFIYILKGKGYTIVSGEKHAWKAGDLVQLPLRPEGIEFQHFNTGSEEVELVACEPNHIDALGVDRGSGLEQLEDAPEFAARR